MAEPAVAGPLTEGQSGAIKRAEGTQHALSEAQHALYLALGRAQPARERRWATKVATALEGARGAIRRHRDEVAGDGGLYDEFRFEAPWLVPRVDQLITQLRRIEAEAGDLATEVQRVVEGDLQAMPAIRSEAERLGVMVRDLMAKEVDLIYERFNEPAALD